MRSNTLESTVIHSYNVRDPKVLYIYFRHTYFNHILEGSRWAYHTLHSRSGKKYRLNHVQKAQKSTNQTEKKRIPSEGLFSFGRLNHVMKAMHFDTSLPLKEAGINRVIDCLDLATYEGYVTKRALDFLEIRKC